MEQSAFAQDNYAETEPAVYDLFCVMSPRQEGLSEILYAKHNELKMAIFYALGGVVLLLVLGIIPTIAGGIRLNGRIGRLWFFALISPFAAIFTFVKAMTSVRNNINDFKQSGETAAAELSEEIAEVSRLIKAGGIIIPVAVVVFAIIAALTFF
ncbi:hypothetical protein FACS1894133_3380 [Clostridia bacterium]|nr:hypothetical protein FACS1894133_3380 [Clostridia bacterium]